MVYTKEKTANNFGGLGGQKLASAQAVILPVPYEGTVSYRPGASRGPEAIIQASRHMEFYDLELDCEIVERVNIYTLPVIQVKNLSVEKMVATVEKRYSELAQTGKFVAMLGGEHSISYAVEKPLRQECPNLSVLQWDAHADLRDIWEGTPFSHACAMRRFYDNVDRVVQVGVRSLSQEEADYIKTNNLRKNIFTPAEFDVDKIVSRLSRDVYITVDLDGFDPSIMPATGTPEPGGLLWMDFLKLMRKVFEKKNVVGFDVMELSPIKNQPASDFLAALAVYKMIGYKFCLKK
ncbi:MAG: agmatinase [Patescibacteria group bacterium]